MPLFRIRGLVILTYSFLSFLGSNIIKGVRPIYSINELGVKQMDVKILLGK